MFPEEIREMKEPSRFFLSLDVAYVLIVAMYAINASLGYAIWGDFVYGDFTANLPDGNSKRGAAAMAFVFLVTDCTTAHVLYIGVVERHCGLNPLKCAPWTGPHTVWCTPHTVHLP